MFPKAWTSSTTGLTRRLARTCAARSRRPSRSTSGRMRPVRRGLGPCSRCANSPTAKGLRGEGVPRDRLALALGQDGHRILDRLASSRVRLIVEEREGGRCGLSHDWMAAVVTRFAEEEPIRRRLGVDERIMALRRIVSSRTELWKTKDTTAPQLPGDQHRRIAASVDALVWTEDQRGWWNDCVAYQQRRWKQIAVGAAATAVIAIAGAVFAWQAYQDRQNRIACGASTVQSPDVVLAERSATRVRRDQGRAVPDGERQVEG